MTVTYADGSTYTGHLDASGSRQRSGRGGKLSRGPLTVVGAFDNDAPSGIMDIFITAVNISTSSDKDSSSAASSQSSAGSNKHHYRGFMVNDQLQGPSITVFAPGNNSNISNSANNNAEADSTLSLSDIGAAVVMGGMSSSASTLLSVASNTKSSRYHGPTRLDFKNPAPVLFSQAASVHLPAPLPLPTINNNNNSNSNSNLTAHSANTTANASLSSPLKSSAYSKSGVSASTPSTASTGSDSCNTRNNSYRTVPATVPASAWGPQQVLRVVGNCSSDNFAAATAAAASAAASGALFTGGGGGNAGAMAGLTGAGRVAAAVAAVAAAAPGGDALPPHFANAAPSTPMSTVTSTGTGTTGTGTSSTSAFAIAGTAAMVASLPPGLRNNCSLMRNAVILYSDGSFYMGDAILAPAAALATALSSSSHSNNANTGKSGGSSNKSGAVGLSNNSSNNNDYDDDDEDNDDIATTGAASATDAEAEAEAEAVALDSSPAALAAAAAATASISPVSALDCTVRVVRHGRGTLVLATARVVHSGHWRLDKRQGKGQTLALAADSDCDSDCNNDAGNTCGTRAHNNVVDAVLAGLLPKHMLTTPRVLTLPQAKGGEVDPATDPLFSNPLLTSNVSSGSNVSALLAPPPSAKYVLTKVYEAALKATTGTENSLSTRSANVRGIHVWGHRFTGRYHNDLRHGNGTYEYLTQDFTSSNHTQPQQSTDVATAAAAVDGAKALGGLAPLPPSPVTPYLPYWGVVYLRSHWSHDWPHTNTANANSNANATANSANTTITAANANGTTGSAAKGVGTSANASGSFGVLSECKYGVLTHLHRQLLKEPLLTVTSPNTLAITPQSHSPSSSSSKTKSPASEKGADSASDASVCFSASKGLPLSLRAVQRVLDGEIMATAVHSSSGRGWGRRTARALGHVKSAQGDRNSGGENADAESDSEPECEREQEREQLMDSISVFGLPDVENSSATSSVSGSASSRSVTTAARLAATYTLSTTPYINSNSNGNSANTNTLTAEQLQRVSELQALALPLPVAFVGVFRHGSRVTGTLTYSTGAVFTGSFACYDGKTALLSTSAIGLRAGEYFSEWEHAAKETVGEVWNSKCFVSSNLSTDAVSGSIDVSSLSKVKFSGPPTVLYPNISSNNNSNMRARTNTYASTIHSDDALAQQCQHFLTYYSQTTKNNDTNITNTAIAVLALSSTGGLTSAEQPDFPANGRLAYPAISLSPAPVVNTNATDANDAAALAAAAEAATAAAAAALASNSWTQQQQQQQPFSPTASGESNPCSRERWLSVVWKGSIDRHLRRQGLGTLRYRTTGALTPATSTSLTTATPLDSADATAVNATFSASVHACVTYDGVFIDDVPVCALALPYTPSKYPGSSKNKSSQSNKSKYPSAAASVSAADANAHGVLKSLQPSLGRSCSWSGPVLAVPLTATLDSVLYSHQSPPQSAHALTSSSSSHSKAHLDVSKCLPPRIAPWQTLTGAPVLLLRYGAGTVTFHSTVSGRVTAQVATVVGVASGAVTRGTLAAGAIATALTTSSGNFPLTSAAGTAVEQQQQGAEEDVDDDSDGLRWLRVGSGVYTGCLLDSTPLPAPATPMPLTNLSTHTSQKTTNAAQKPHESGVSPSNTPLASAAAAAAAAAASEELARFFFATTTVVPPTRHGWGRSVHNTNNSATVSSHSANSSSGSGSNSNASASGVGSSVTFTGLFFRNLPALGCALRGSVSTSSAASLNTSSTNTEQGDSNKSATGAVKNWALRIAAAKAAIAAAASSLPSREIVLSQFDARGRRHGGCVALLGRRRCAVQSSWSKGAVKQGVVWFGVGSNNTASSNSNSNNAKSVGDSVNVRSTAVAIPSDISTSTGGVGQSGLPVALEVVDALMQSIATAVSVPSAHSHSAAHSHPSKCSDAHSQLKWDAFTAVSLATPLDDITSTDNAPASETETETETDGDFATATAFATAFLCALTKQAQHESLSSTATADSAESTKEVDDDSNRLTTPLDAFLALESSSMPVSAAACVARLLASMHSFRLSTAPSDSVSGASDNNNKSLMTPESVASALSTSAPLEDGRPLALSSPSASAHYILDLLSQYDAATLTNTNTGSHSAVLAGSQSSSLCSANNAVSNAAAVPPRGVYEDELALLVRVLTKAWDLAIADDAACRILADTHSGNQTEPVAGSPSALAAAGGNWSSDRSLQPLPSPAAYLLRIVTTALPALQRALPKLPFAPLLTTSTSGGGGESDGSEQQQGIALRLPRLWRLSAPPPDALGQLARGVYKGGLDSALEPHGWGAMAWRTGRGAGAEENANHSQNNSENANSDDDDNNSDSGDDDDDDDDDECEDEEKASVEEDDNVENGCFAKRHVKSKCDFNTILSLAGVNSNGAAKSKKNTSASGGLTSASVARVIKRARAIAADYNSNTHHSLAAAAAKNAAAAAANTTGKPAASAATTATASRFAQQQPPPPLSQPFARAPARAYSGHWRHGAVHGAGRVLYALPRAGEVAAAAVAHALVTHAAELNSAPLSTTPLDSGSSVSTQQQQGALLGPVMLPCARAFSGEFAEGAPSHGTLSFASFSKARALATAALALLQQEQQQQNAEHASSAGNASASGVAALLSAVASEPLAQALASTPSLASALPALLQLLPVSCPLPPQPVSRYRGSLGPGGSLTGTGTLWLRCGSGHRRTKREAAAKRRLRVRFDGVIEHAVPVAGRLTVTTARNSDRNSDKKESKYPSEECKGDLVWFEGSLNRPIDAAETYEHNFQSQTSVSTPLDTASASSQSGVFAEDIAALLRGDYDDDDDDTDHYFSSASTLSDLTCHSNTNASAPDDCGSINDATNNSSIGTKPNAVVNSGVALPAHASSSARLANKLRLLLLPLAFAAAPPRGLDAARLAATLGYGDAYQLRPTVAEAARRAASRKLKARVRARKAQRRNAPPAAAGAASLANDDDDNDLAGEEEDATAAVVSSSSYSASRSVRGQQAPVLACAQTFVHAYGLAAYMQTTNPGIDASVESHSSIDGNSATVTSPCFNESDVMVVSKFAARAHSLARRLLTLSLCPASSLPPLGSFIFTPAPSAASLLANNNNNNNNNNNGAIPSASAVMQCTSVDPFAAAAAAVPCLNTWVDAARAAYVTSRGPAAVASASSSAANTALSTSLTIAASQAHSHHAGSGASDGDGFGSVAIAAPPLEWRLVATGNTGLALSNTNTTSTSAANAKTALAATAPQQQQQQQFVLLSVPMSVVAAQSFDAISDSKFFAFNNNSNNSSGASSSSTPISSTSSLATSSGNSSNSANIAGVSSALSALCMGGARFPIDTAGHVYHAAPLVRLTLKHPQRRDKKTLRTDADADADAAAVAAAVTNDTSAHSRSVVTVDGDESIEDAVARAAALQQLRTAVYLCDPVVERHAMQQRLRRRARRAAAAALFPTGTYIAGLSASGSSVPALTLLKPATAGASSGTAARSVKSGGLWGDAPAMNSSAAATNGGARVSERVSVVMARPLVRAASCTPANSSFASAPVPVGVVYGTGLPFPVTRVFVWGDAAQNTANAASGGKSASGCVVPYRSSAAANSCVSTTKNNSLLAALFTETLSAASDSSDSDDRAAESWRVQAAALSRRVRVLLRNSTLAAAAAINTNIPHGNDASASEEGAAAREAAAAAASAVADLLSKLQQKQQASAAEKAAFFASALTPILASLVPQSQQPHSQQVTVSNRATVSKSWPYLSSVPQSQLLHPELSVTLDAIQRAALGAAVEDLESKIARVRASVAEAEEEALRLRKEARTRSLTLSLQSNNDNNNTASDSAQQQQQQ